MTPGQLRNSAAYTEALQVKRGLAFVTVEAVGHTEQLRAHAALMERHAELEKIAEAMADYLTPTGERCGCECKVCKMVAAYRAWRDK